MQVDGDSGQGAAAHTGEVGGSGCADALDSGNNARSRAACAWDSLNGNLFTGSAHVTSMRSQHADLLAHESSMSSPLAVSAALTSSWRGGGRGSSGAVRLPARPGCRHLQCETPPQGRGGGTRSELAAASARRLRSPALGAGDASARHPGLPTRGPDTLDAGKRLAVPPWGFLGAGAFAALQSTYAFHGEAGSRRGLTLPPWALPTRLHPVPSALAS